jgi:O-antigen ligase
MIAQISFRQNATAKLEFYLLCVVLFVLPTLESPKTIALVLYLIVWAARRFSFTKLLQFRPHVIEVCLMAVLAASAASTALNWPFPNGVKGLWDTSRFTLLFWCIYRAGYNDSQYRALAIVVTAGLIVGLAFGVFELATGRIPQLQLHSAGVLTQSAMYVSMVFVLALGVFLTRWLPRSGNADTGRRRWPWLAALFAMSAALVIMGSRGAFLALAVILACLALLVNHARLWALLAGAAVAVVAALFAIHLAEDGGRITASAHARLNPERLAVSNLERYEYLRVGAAQIREGGSLWFGIGPRNFRSIDVPRLHFDPPLLLTGEQIAKLGHAHNLFLTKLVEEGVAGLAALVFFFGLVARGLWRAWRRQEWYDWRWFAAFGALAVPVIAGSVNTPFFQEHAMLAMALMAIFMRSSQPVGHRR